VNFGRDGTTDGKISPLETITLEEKSPLAQLSGIRQSSRLFPGLARPVDNTHKLLNNLPKYDENKRQWSDWTASPGAGAATTKRGEVPFLRERLQPCSAPGLK
jgi:hypothetical protein